MKIHFGFIENYGDYESPCYGCENSICGLSTENVIENCTEDWDEVTCKNCLRLKTAVISSLKLDEEIIVNQMGDMAEFFKKEKIIKELTKQ